MIDICVKALRVSYLNVDVYYWVQRPKSISHYEGKKKRTEKFISDMFWYIDEKQKLLLNGSAINPQFTLWIKGNLNYHAFRILHLAFRFLPLKKSRDYILELQKRNLYPIGEGVYLQRVKQFPLLRSLMNRRKVWLTCSFLFHLLPRIVRLKVY